jgi:uncharacterized protein (DUF58 family)
LETGQQREQLTSLFDNSVLSRLERLRINATRRFTNKSRGEHLTGRGGNSIDFSDYRDYSPGDDIRFVDWNIFSRLNRPYLKLFELEEEMHVAVIVDASSSMMFENKLDRAKQLAAAFGVMGLFGNECVSVDAFNSRDESISRFPRCIGRASMMKMFSFVERVEGGGDAPLETGIESFLKFHSGRGTAVVLSDFMTFGDLTRAFNLLFGSGLEIFAVQILGPSEIDPEVTGDLRLVDIETELGLNVSANPGLLRVYQEYRGIHERHVGDLCKQRCGRFLSISSQDSLNWVLFDLFRRRGWVE